MTAHIPADFAAWVRDGAQLELGEQRRDIGCAKVAANNESYCDRFHAAAADILAIADEVTSDIVIERIGMPAGHPSAIGAAMRSFAKANKLKVAHYVKSTRPSCHAAVIAVWRH